MNEFNTLAALKTFGLAALGFVVVLAIGVAIGLSMDGDGFAGLGVIAFTTVILAPIGAVIGAFVGNRRFGSPQRGRAGWGVTAVIAALVVASMVFVDAPFQIMIGLLGLAVLLIVRSGMGTSAEAVAVGSDAPAV